MSEIRIQKYVSITSGAAVSGGAYEPYVGVPVPPAGFVFLVKSDGTYWTNPDGAFYIKAAA